VADSYSYSFDGLRNYTRTDIDQTYKRAHLADKRQNSVEPIRRPSYSSSSDVQTGDPFQALGDNTRFSTFDQNGNPSAISQTVFYGYGTSTPPEETRSICDGRRLQIKNHLFKTSYDGSYNNYGATQGMFGPHGQQFLELEFRWDLDCRNRSGVFQVRHRSNLQRTNLAGRRARRLQTVVNRGYSFGDKEDPASAESSYKDPYQNTIDGGFNRSYTVTDYSKSYDANGKSFGAPTSWAIRRIKPVFRKLWMDIP